MRDMMPTNSKASDNAGRSQSCTEQSQRIRLSKPALQEGIAAQMAVALGLAKNTRLSYGRDIEEFSRFLEHVGKGKSLFDANRRDVLDFIDAGKHEGLAATTLSRRLMALRTLYGWLAGEGGITENPTESVERPKLPRRLPETLSEKDVAALTAAFDGDNTPLALRNRAMLHLLYACGLRASELIGLTLDNVDLGEAKVRCIGKGSKERVVPIGSIAVNALVDYLTRGRSSLDRGAGSEVLFLSQRGAHALSRQMLWNVVCDAAKRSGLWKRVHPHTLRHCFASHLLAHGAGIRPIQEMLGHADIATTQIYTHVDTDKILEVHRKFHPRR